MVGTPFEDCQMQLIIEYPQTLPAATRQSRDEFEREARLAMAVKLFEMKRVSSGIAAQLAGMNRVDFLLALSRFQVPMINIPPEQLDDDLKNA